MPLIDEAKLNEYADVVFNRCNALNDYVLETIGRRIKATGQLSAFDQQTLKNMADISGDMEAITKKLAEVTELNISDIEQIYTQVMTDSVNTYRPLYDFKGMKFVPFEQNGYAQALVKHWATETVGVMVNLSRTKALCFEKCNINGEVINTMPLQGAFQKAIDDAVIAVSTGTTDFNTAMRQTIIDLGGSGVKVSYGNNVNRSLSGMVRQTLLYGAKQSAQAYDKYVGEQLGCDGFEVEYHPHPRPSHEFMGGKMYSYGDSVTINGKTYESGSEALARLNDYGCLHFKTDVILGVSEPRYDEKWLEEQKAKDKELIEFDGRQKTMYEWQQTQSRFEAAARKERDTAFMAKASGNNILKKQCLDKVEAYKSKYDEMCDAVGLEKRHNRMASYSGKNSVDFGSKSGIIGEKEQSPRKMKRGNYAVDWSKIHSDSFRNRLSVLSDDEKVVNAIETRAKWALNNRDGKDTEELYAISLKTGKQISAITDQEIPFGIKRTDKFVADLEKADSEGDSILLIHNHPKGLPPSLSDLNVLLENKDIAGITSGHNGSIYYYSKPKETIGEAIYNSKLRKYKKYSETTSMEKSLTDLSEEYSFEFKILRGV